MIEQLETIGVIGAGQMGSGIAQVCAAAGLEVRLNDREADRIEAGLGQRGEGGEGPGHADPGADAGQRHDGGGLVEGGVDRVLQQVPDDVGEVEDVDVDVVGFTTHTHELVDQPCPQIRLVSRHSHCAESNPTNTPSR